MSNSNSASSPSPLSFVETKDLCEELGRRSPMGVYVMMMQPPVDTKADEVCAGFYYKVPNVDGIARILGHTLMWFLGSRVMPPPAPKGDVFGGDAT